VPEVYLVEITLINDISDLPNTFFLTQRLRLAVSIPASGATVVDIVVYVAVLVSLCLCLS